MMNASPALAASGTVPADFLAGGGEMGALMRAHDWRRSPLGPPQDWPDALKTAVSLCLNSRFPILLWWGPDLVTLYNDAWRPVAGSRKHPRGLGRPGIESWAEIWDTIGPQLAGVMRDGDATWSKDMPLFLDRHGYLEETIFTYAYSPIKDAAGRIGGVFSAVYETTEQIIGARRLEVLRMLGAGTAEQRSVADACRAIDAILTGRPDTVFSLIFLAGPDGTARLMSAPLGGVPADVALDGSDPRKIAETIRTGRVAVLDDLAGRFDDLPCGPWPEPPSHVAVLPIANQGQLGSTAGALLVGINPRRRPDDDYLGFLGLVAGHVASAVAAAGAHEAERRRAEALAELDRAKTAFFSNVSHEFRTPLTLLLGPLAECLSGTQNLPRDIAARLEMAQRSGLRLLKLVNTLLDFSRIEADRVQAHFAPTDLAQLTADLAASFREVSERAGLRMTVDCPPLPQPVHVDRDMWEKVVLNLLSNAFKFTLEGGIAVALRPSADGAAAELCVSDTGSGIPAAELSRVFERFRRVEGAPGRSFEGSGIGLALVRELVRLHGGTIAVQSAVGQGSSFTVGIPFGTAHLPADQLVAVGPAGALRGADAFVEEALGWLGDDAGAHVDGLERDEAPDVPTLGEILLADDNADMRRYLRRLLTDQGYRVTPAADGAAALALARCRPPDLVLADAMMPTLDGFGLLAALRGDAALAGVPVVLLSARAGEAARVEGLQAGADDYLVKPFAARDLCARVGAHIALARARREAAEAQRARAAELQAVLDAVPTAVWVTRDPEAREAWCNRQAAELLRLDGSGTYQIGSRDRLGYTVVRDGVEAPPDALPFARAARGEDTAPEELTLRFADGDVRHVVSQARPLRDAHRTVSGAVLAVVDVTQRRLAEAALLQANATLEARVADRTAQLERTIEELRTQMEERERMEATLRQMQRLEAIGQLTAGVAHDFNNLLTVILGNVEFLEREVAGAPARRLATLRAAAQRGASLTGQLLAFARRQQLQPRPVDLNQVVAGMADLLRTSVGGAVRIQTALHRALWPAMVDQPQIELAIVNLVLNARDAMPAGGTLTIATANTRLDAPLRAGQPPAGDYVTLRLDDTGTGMGQDVQERAFEPFFTTKPAGTGSGLGLAQVYGFVQQSGGDATIASRPGEGTTVTLHLPRAAAAAVSEIVAPALPVRRARILLADDDEAVREVTAAMLEAAGYAVTRAASAPAALAALDDGAPVDLLVADFLMPGMNGLQLARAARERRERLPVLFVTGYAATALLTDIADAAVLRKPFHSDDLQRSVAGLLRARDTVRAAG